jgi:lipopolysaccharide transport system permease protein
MDRVRSPSDVAALRVANRAHWPVRDIEGITIDEQVFESVGRLMSTIGMIKGAWRFRDFIVASVRREFAIRYQGTQLGIFWPILQPLALILIYTLVFAEIMKPKLPGHESPYAYSIYLTAGLIIWGLFSDLLNRSVGIFVQNANLLKKVSVPKITFPVIASFSALVHFAIIFVLFLAFLVFSSNFPGTVILGVVPILALTLLLAVGMGILLGTVNVFYRDVEQSAGLFLQFWFWLTPIVYPARALPDFMAAILVWNPMWPIVLAVQDIFVEQRFPNWSTLVYPLLLAMVFVVGARLAFNRLSAEIVDEL